MLCIEQYIFNNTNTYRLQNDNLKIFMLEKDDVHLVVVAFVVAVDHADNITIIYHA